MKYLITTLLLASCTASPKVFEEPTRTAFYHGCLASHATVSLCACVEWLVVARNGVVEVTETNMEVEQAEIQEVLPECLKEQEKLINERSHRGQDQIH